MSQNPKTPPKKPNRVLCPKCGGYGTEGVFFTLGGARAHLLRNCQVCLGESVCTRYRQRQYLRQLRADILAAMVQARQLVTDDFVKPDAVGGELRVVAAKPQEWNVADFDLGAALTHSKFQLATNIGAQNFPGPKGVE